MGEEHRINEIKGVIISRALLKEYGYDGDMPTDKQMQVIGNGLLEYNLSDFPADRRMNGC